MGIEPTILGVLDPCSNQQSYEGALEIAGVINNNKSIDITIQKPTNQLPRVQYNPLPATLPRVHQSKNLEPSQQSTSITALQTHSNLPKIYVFGILYLIDILFEIGMLVPILDSLQPII